jgi:uncharacterized membrane protein
VNRALESVTKSLVVGLLIVTPIYLALLVLLKAAKSVVGLVRPFAKLLPQSLPAEQLLSLLLVLLVCTALGAAARTPAGRAARKRAESTFLEKIPGYELFRSFTMQLSGDTQEDVWHPALVEIEDALVPAFIIEEFDDGRCTVFVPSIPTPFAGAVYVLDRARVHRLDVPFTQALRTVSRWGSGAKDLVAAMTPESDART